MTNPKRFAFFHFNFTLQVHVYIALFLAYRVLLESLQNPNQAAERLHTGAAPKLHGRVYVEVCIQTLIHLSI